MKKFSTYILIAIMMVNLMNIPMFAAQSTGADKLYENGFIAGDSGNLMVDKAFTRAEACVLLAEMYGKKGDASKMAYIKYFSDVNSSDWFAPYVTYAKTQNWVSGYPEGDFKPNNGVTQQEWSTMLMKVLGYDFTWDSVNDDIQTIGIEIDKKNSDLLIRGDAFEVMWQVVNTPRKGKTQSLGVEIGRLEDESEPIEDDVEIVDKPLKLAGYQTVSLKQILIKFNQEVNVETAEKISNYSLYNSNNDDVQIVDITYNEEDLEAVITLAKAQESDEILSLEIENMTAPLGTELTKVSYPKIEMIDVTLPKIRSIELVSVDAFKIYFTEPIRGDEDINPSEDNDDINELSPDDFRVEDDEYYVRSAVLDSLGMSVLVTLYSDIDENFKVKVQPTVKDFYGYNVLEPEKTVKYKKDSTAPKLVGYKNATNTSVTLIFSEDIKLLNSLSENYYHDDKLTVDTSLTANSINGNELFLPFTKNPLSDGKNTIVVKSKSVSDLWGNKNETMDISVVVEEDDLRPQLKNVVMKQEDELNIIVNKPLDNSSNAVTDSDNYTILDDAGKDITSKISTISYNAAANTIMVYFTENLNGEYTLTLENQKDYSNNKFEIDDYEFFVSDSTVPDPEDWTAKYYDNGGSKKLIKIKFGEKMNKSDIGKISNYSVNGVALDTIDSDKVSIIVTDNDSAVEIYIYDEAHGGMDVEVNGDGSANIYDDIAVARIADAAGNYTDSFVNAIDLQEMGEVSLLEAKLVDDKEIVLVFDDIIKSFYTSDLEVLQSGEEIKITGYKNTVNSDNQSEITLSLKEALRTDAYKVKINIDGEKSKNRYGEVLEQVSSVKVEDKLPPRVEITEFDDLTAENVYFDYSSSEIIIVMTEDIDASSLSKDTFVVKNARVIDATSDDERVIITINENDIDKIAVGTTISQQLPFEDMEENAISGLYLSVQEID